MTPQPVSPEVTELVQRFRDIQRRWRKSYQRRRALEERLAPVAAEESKLWEQVRAAKALLPDDVRAGLNT